MPEQLAFSISCTTRSPRTGETDGVEYYFTSVEDFEKKISKSELAEWEMVYVGKYYGTPVRELERIGDWLLNKSDGAEEKTGVCIDGSCAPQTTKRAYYERTGRSVNS